MPGCSPTVSTRNQAGAVSAWRFAGILFGWLILLSPVVHPWYVCWMLLLISVDGSLAWLVLSVTMIFARHVYIGYEQSGVWQEAWWARLAVWVPFYIALLAENILLRFRSGKR